MDEHVDAAAYAVVHKYRLTPTPGVYATMMRAPRGRPYKGDVQMAKKK